MTTWILVAQGAAAKIINVKKNGEEISLIQEFFHPNTAKKGSDIYTDRPGRSFQSADSTRHAVSSSEELQDHERRVFAKEIANFLATAHATNQFAKIIVVSSRDLLGDLRKAFEAPVKNAVTHELSKDLYSQGLSNAQLVAKIRTDLDLITL